MSQEEDDYIEQKMFEKDVKESYVVHAEDLVKYKSTLTFKQATGNDAVNREIYKKDLNKFGGKDMCKTY